MKSVMKKIIEITLIISMVNLLGCYYQEQMTPVAYDFDEHSDIQVSTSDTTYKLMGDDYHFANDTLFATLSTKIDRQTTLKTNIKIPEENIKSNEIERTDTGMTILLTTGILIGVLGHAFVLGFDMQLDIKGPGESSGNSL
ncbi:MAG: hypothetical protein HND39_03225 [Ignavibacteriota bacterium]|jgi:hypothetical protein|nr:MAG: hypothetical protein EDM72_06710 [Chlorobiota bacterium]MBE7475269.1 hypothetical protein [Ignavibacteriales bacterium]MBL1122236.1 hypothetical protein [Ignavibacteriota bacterium]MCC7093257.1 hypothetical protein [Ignavibacteriaceae bacterium]MCE7855391.1 hypothetical protein [Ignavibacteria bacterium CHB3]MEB2298007.1 hypothetical protein [Ignavibacteria bacterium]